LTSGVRQLEDIPLLLVLPDEIDTQENDRDKLNPIEGHVNREAFAVAWGIICAED
jgi:hypothetical protein